MKTVSAKKAKAGENAKPLNSVRSSEKSKADIGRKMLFRKELADHLHSKRFWILLVLIAAVCFASLYSAVTAIKASEDTIEFVFLSLFTMGTGSIPTFTNGIAMIGPLVGLAMGFDAINSERSGGTLNRLVSQPIYRDSIIIAKFLAGTTLITIMIFAIGIINCCVGVLTTGLLPQTQEVYRIFMCLCFTVVYIAFWLALSIFFSVVCRHTATSAMGVLTLWIFFTLFMSLVAKIIADSVYPLEHELQIFMHALDNYNLQLNINRFSPYYLYGEAASTIMSPSVRSINILTSAQTQGAIAGYLTFGQSLLLVWPHLVALIALMVVSFAGSYIGFMRQEIRS